MIDEPMENFLDRQDRSCKSLSSGACQCYRCLRERNEIQMRHGSQSCACGCKRDAQKRRIIGSHPQEVMIRVNPVAIINNGLRAEGMVPGQCRA
jgi:hypothetical protein